MENLGQKLADKLQKRLTDFAVRIIKVAGALRRTEVGRHICGQLLRAGTSPAPNYAEARSAESRADFVHKLKVGLKELNETSVWLDMIVLSELIKPAHLTKVVEENKELCKMINASITTSKSRLVRTNDK